MHPITSRVGERSPDVPGGQARVGSGSARSAPTIATYRPPQSATSRSRPDGTPDAGFGSVDSRSDTGRHRDPPHSPSPDAQPRSPATPVHPRHPRLVATQRTEPGTVCAFRIGSAHGTVNSTDGFPPAATTSRKPLQAARQVPRGTRRPHPQHTARRPPDRTPRRCPSSPRRHRTETHPTPPDTPSSHGRHPSKPDAVRRSEVPPAIPQRRGNRSSYPVPIHR